MSVDAEQALGSSRNDQEAPRLLGLFAHPDDEIFGIGGTFAKYIADGAEAMVVSFTRGEAGQIRDAAVATRRTLGETRERELRLACQTLGVQHACCLHYPDGRLKDIPQTQLVGQAVEIIRKFRPHVVFTFDEIGGYGHPDHIAMCRVTTDACMVAGNADQFPEQLQSGLLPHTPTRLYQCYFPRSGRLLLQLLVDWLQSVDTRFRGSDDFVHALMLFADGSTMLGYASDYLDVQWYPKGFYIIEQGEPATSLYLILSGTVDVVVEDEAGHSQYITTHGPGVFIGETGLAYGKPRNAHVIARESTTCLVFSPGEPSSFAGRGEFGEFAVKPITSLTSEPELTTCRIDVGSFVQSKIEALSRYRSQYPINPAMFPLEMFKELLGTEYFVQAFPPRAIETELVF